jgi:hypothetical protein
MIKHEKYFHRNNHVFQLYLEDLWSCDHKTKTYLNITIINLLKEVPIFEFKKELNEETKRKTSICINLNQSIAPGAAGGGGGVGGKSSANMASVGGATLATSQVKGDFTSLIGAGLIGALNTNALTSNLFSIGSTEESAFNKRLLSRYGSYLIISLIKPDDFVDDWETFGKIISMVIQWFHMVCYIPSDSSGEIISKLRTRVNIK